MKIEIIRIFSKLVHFSSKETKTIKLSTKGGWQEALDYVEQYIEQSGMKLLNANWFDERAIFFLVDQ